MVLHVEQAPGDPASRRHGRATVTDRDGPQRSKRCKNAAIEPVQDQTPTRQDTARDVMHVTSMPWTRRDVEGHDVDVTWT